MSEDKEHGWLEWHITVLDVLLRVPPLFVLDALCNGALPWPSDQWIECIGIMACGLIYVLLVFSAFIASVLMFTLTFETLFNVYRLLLAAAALYASFAVNRQHIIGDISTTTFSETSPDLLLHSPSFSGTTINIFVQISLAFLFDNLVNRQVQTVLPRICTLYLRSPPMHTYVFFLLPVALRTILSSSNFHEHQIFFIAFFMSIASAELGVDLTITVSSAVKSIFRSCTTLHNVVEEVGMPEFLIAHWQRIRVATVFRLFWITRAAAYFVFVGLAASRNDATDDVGETVLVWFHRLAVDITVHGCETTIALIGMSCIVSYIAHYVGVLVTFLAGCHNQDVNREIGTMSAMLFFILALQSSITDMDSAHRVTRIFRNFCLLVIAMIHFIHVSIDEHLLALSAGGLNTSISKHIKALAVSLTLGSFAVVYCVVLWTQYEMGTWLFAMTIFTAELVVKTTVTLLVYALFMIDARRENIWEALDDYVYWIRSTGSCVEFVFGTILFGNGLWILFFESQNAIRASMMCINAYFNIWKQARDGWTSFRKRRTAVDKINRLSEASLAEMEAYANVCAICYQDLSSARVTKCKHMFHGVCLRKWLYTQDWCPLCQQSISPVAEATSAVATVVGAH